MKQYESYKRTPLKWLGGIPSHWIFTKNRYGFCKKKNIYNESEDTNVLTLSIKGVKIKRDLSFGKSTESYIGHQLVKNGDMVFTPRDFDQTPILSDVSEYDGCISNLYIVDNTKDGVLNHYVNYYWYGLKYSVNYFKNFSHGIRFSFNRFQFDQIPLLVPPLSEQKQIVSLLDYKTQLIDELIEKTERKIELLKEKRTSLINHCVTKGLNPNVEMKDSGVEWIGEIPGHWDSIPIKYTLEKNRESIRTGPFGSQLKSDDMVDEGIKIYNQRTVYDEDFTKGEIYVTPKRYDAMKGFTVLNGDILISSRGTIGKMAIVPDGAEIGVLHPCLIRLRVDTDYLYKRYLWWYMNHSSLFLESVKYESNSTTIDVIYSNVLTEIRFPLPSLREQQQMVEYLDEQTQNIDTTVDKETQRIELLKEYRKSLVSEVVTGKIDVRGYDG